MSKEAMKLALEALETIAKVEHPSHKVTHRKPVNGHVVTIYPHKVASDAITALKQALEQPEPEPVAWAISFDGETPYTLWDGGDCALLDIEVKRHGGKTRKMPLYTAPPKREPPCKTGSQCTTKCMECTEPEPVIDKSAAIRIATSLGWTPQRKPLTDEEIMDNWLKVMWAVGDRNKLPIPEFARAIEAAHGIRGKHD